MTDDEERELIGAVMQADLRLKTRQAFWETPRNLVLIIGTATGIAGLLGFKLGQREPTAAPPTQIIFQLGSIIAAPAPAPVPTQPPPVAAAQ